MFTLENVTKVYGAAAVLKDIVCDIPTRGFVFIMGPSGSGKSTLLRVLSFVELPDSGHLRLSLDDMLFDSSRPERPWPKLTCVFQKQFLWPHLTLRQNIFLPLQLSRVPKADAKMAEVIDMFDMFSFVDRFPNEVSGGQAQRAALARAFVLNPKIILIDEAHAGLDLEQQAILNEYLVKLEKSGVALIVVTHSLEFARQYATHLVILEQGVITERGDRTIFAYPQSMYLRRALGLSVSASQSLMGRERS